MASTPKSEGGGLQQSPEKTKDSRFVIIEKEQVKEETEIKKPHNNKQKNKKAKNESGEIKLLG